MSYESEKVKQGFTSALFDAIERGLGERTIEVFSSSERQRAFFEYALDAGPYRAGVEVFLRPILSDCGILDATVQAIVSDAASLLHQSLCRMAAHLAQLGFDPFEDRFEWSASTYFSEVAIIVGADAPYSINDYVKVFDRACAWIKAETVRQRLAKQLTAPTDQGPIGLRVTQTYLDVPSKDAPTETPPSNLAPALDDADVAILRYLAEMYPLTKSQSDIEAGSLFSRGTISRRLKTLRELGLTHRPKGDKAGDAITNQGREVLQRLPPA